MLDKDIATCHIRRGRCLRGKCTRRRRGRLGLGRLDRNDPWIREQFIEIMYELGVPTRRSILNGPSDHSSSSRAHRAVSPASRTMSSSSIIGLGQDDLIHKVPLVGTLEPCCHLVPASPSQGSHRRGRGSSLRRTSLSRVLSMQSARDRHRCWRARLRPWWGRRQRSWSRRV